jgi:RimJ/RimL family protein N-acetyltransferase
VSLEAAQYSAVERLRDGHSVTVRAVKPEDRDELVAAVDRVSAHSFYLRFFSAKRALSEKQIDFFLNVDFTSHVALVAVVEEGARPVIAGGGRYVVVQPGVAEVAFAVLDEYQGRGLGPILMRHLVTIARAAGIRRFVAEVLTQNAPMLKVFEKCGFRLSTTREAEVVHVSMEIES